MTLQEGHDDFKKAINNMKLVIMPDYKKDFILETDASNVGLGKVIMQERTGKTYPI